MQARLSPEDNRAVALTHTELHINEEQWLAVRIRRGDPSKVTVEVDGKAFFTAPVDERAEIADLAVEWFATDGSGAFLASLDNLVAIGAR